MNEQLIHCVRLVEFAVDHISPPCATGKKYITTVGTMDESAFLFGNSFALDLHSYSTNLMCILDSIHIRHRMLQVKLFPQCQNQATNYYTKLYLCAVEPAWYNKLFPTWFVFKVSIPYLLLYSSCTILNKNVLILYNSNLHSYSGEEKLSVFPDRS